MRLSAPFQQIVRPLVEYRILLSLGLSATCGIVLNTLYPINQADPLLRLVALERPSIYLGLVRSYDLFLYSTAFLIFSVLFSLVYVHIYRKELKQGVGSLPPCPDPLTRDELQLVLGEVHRQLVPRPSPTPRWLSIPERGLYTGIASFGSIGSGKTLGLILPAMRQLFTYRADDPQQKLSGIVLEVKGDLCRQAQRILKSCGRENDYDDISLDGDLRYNPLNNTLDAYAQAFNIASIITSIWGKGKEPFWQQSYTDLVRYVILLHRIRDGYLTMVDIFRTVISAGRLEELMIEVGTRFSMTSYIGIDKDAYREHEGLLSPYPATLESFSDCWPPNILLCSSALKKHTWCPMAISSLFIEEVIYRIAIASFIIFQFLFERSYCRVSKGLDAKQQFFVDDERFTGGDDHRSIDYVPQLADISGPAVCQQHFHGALFDATYVLCMTRRRG
jgi:hypothetical protein